MTRSLRTGVRGVARNSPGRPGAGRVQLRVRVRVLVLIVIGAMGSFTGVASGSTADAKVLAQDWVSATNASGGIDGHPIQIIFLDDLNTPSTALTNAEQLVNQDHVKAILDLSDDQESTWAKVPDAAKVPVLGQAESPTFGTDPNFYSVGTTVEPLIWGELKAASLAKVTKVGALYCAEIASCSQTVPLITGLAKPMGMTLAYSAKVSSSAVSYTAQCLGAKGAGANGATVVAASNTALNVAESCATQGYKPVWVTTAGEMTTPWLAQSAVNGAIGNVQDVPWFDDSTPATKAMQAAISKYSRGRRDRRRARHARARLPQRLRVHGAGRRARPGAHQRGGAGPRARGVPDAVRCRVPGQLDLDVRHALHA